MRLIDRTVDLARLSMEHDEGASHEGGTRARW